MTQSLQQRINLLLSDPDFLTLKQMHERPNLFGTLGTSYLELWHSAFLKWLIDPSSHHGLGTFPLRRFLYLAASEGRYTDGQPKSISDLTIADIELLSLEDMIFKTEYTDRYDASLQKKRIDILGRNDETRFLIENKIKSREHDDQTRTYSKYADNHPVSYDFRIFLTPDESQMPKDSRFAQITYQEVCDMVIQPCLNHPSLSIDAKYLIEQYLLNLRSPLTSGAEKGFVIAMPNRELCEKIYRQYRDVFDEIFVTVKGEAPAPDGTRTVRRFNPTLTDLLREGYLQLQDTLRSTKNHIATLEMSPDGIQVLINFNGDLYNNPSAPARTLVPETRATNSVGGWKFWHVFDEQGKPKGILYDIREKYKTQKSDENDGE
jgi:hypothetical protein